MRARSGIGSAVNARLEEISFRTGLMTATIALFTLLAIVAAGVYVAALGHGSPAGGAARVASADNAPVRPVTARAATLPRTPGHPQATPKPKSQRTVTADTTSPQPTAGPPPQAQAGSSQPAVPRVPARDYGTAGPYGQGPLHGGYGRGHGGFGLPGPGLGLGPGRGAGPGRMAGRR
jgi:hypothetical protein